MDNQDKKEGSNMQVSIAFEQSHYFMFIYQKAEKISAAVHLITNLIKDEDTIKWQLRKKSLDLLSETVLLYQNDLSDMKQAKRVQGLLVELISLFEIALISKVVSQMNAAILRSELVALVEVIESQLGSVGSENKDQENGRDLVLSQEFFQVEPTDAYKGQSIGHYKRHDNMSLKNMPPFSSFSQSAHSIGQIGNQSNQVPKKSLYKNAASQSKSQANLQGDHNKKTFDSQGSESRRTIIFDVLRKSKDIGVHDLAVVIKDCSEKTIQRELLSMVKDGLLKKQGERRWSRYMLA